MSPSPVIDHTPAFPPAPTAGLADFKRHSTDVEKASPPGSVSYGGEDAHPGQPGPEPQLARRLNARQITFIGFSGGIGTGCVHRACRAVYTGLRIQLTFPWGRPVSLSVSVPRTPSLVRQVFSCECRT